MLIVCPSCATSYQVEAASLGAAGRSVRCVRCRNTWFASNPQALQAVARAHRADVTNFAAAHSVGELAAAREPPPPELPVVVEAPSIDPAVAEDASADQAYPAAEDATPAFETEALPADGDVAAVVQEPAEAVASPPLAPLQDGESAPTLEAAALPPPEDIESFAARRLRRKAVKKRSRWSTTGLPAATFVLLMVNIGLVGWRADVVRWFPQTASLYAAIGLPVNLRGLAFTDIVTRKEVQDGVQVLIVEGFIRNETRRVAPVPRLRFAVRNSNGHEIYSWTAQPARTSIPAGSTLPFRSRLASPPPETREVLVRFFNRRDMVAGIQ